MSFSPIENDHKNDFDTTSYTTITRDSEILQSCSPGDTGDHKRREENIKYLSSPIIAEGIINREW